MLWQPCWQGSAALGSEPFIEPVRAQLAVVEDLVADACGALRTAVVDIGGQWAQYRGWLHANTGRSAEADRLYDRGLEWAVEAGNVNLISEMLSMKPQQAWLI